MKRIYTFAAGLLITSAMTAQVTLPRATFKLDFEGATNVADFGGTQVGDGELRTSDDPNFGTYYQNCPNKAVATKATNYLRVELGDGLSKAGLKTSDNAISLCFWVNPTVANLEFPNISYYWSVLYSIYTKANRGLGPSDGWNGPMWSQNIRGWLQINDWNDRWDDFGDDENISGTNNISTDWLQQLTYEGEVSYDDEGNEIVTTEPMPFEYNWHFVALVLSAAENTATFYVDGEIFNQWNCKSDFYSNGVGNTFFGNLGNYDDLYLGGVAQWTWADPDPAFAYDDFTIYAGSLNLDQQAVIMDIKHGNASDDTKLVIAQSDYQDAVGEYEEFLGKLESYPTLNSVLEELVAGYDDTVDNDPSVEKYEAAANDIRSKIAEQEAIVDAAEALKALINELNSYAEATQYTGKADFQSALSTALSSINDASTMQTLESAQAQVMQAKAKYVVMRDMPTDGSGIDVTAVVMHPWFCNPDAEPTQNEDGTYTFPFVEANGYSVNATPSDQNSEGWVNGNTFTVDDARVNWTEGRITWNNWHNKTNVGTLDVHQTISYLPEGYYSVSADWITNAEPTTQHTYATSGGVTKSSIYLDNQGWDSEIWTTLTTDKIYVGADGELIIGGQSTTIGVAYAGWFCVTNFRLTYYGKEIDLSADLAQKQAEANALVEELVLAGDRTAVAKAINDIAAMDDVYAAIDLLTQKITEIKKMISDENAIINSVDEYNNNTTSTSQNGQKALSAVKAHLTALINGNEASVEMKDNLSQIMSSSTTYIGLLESAEAWGTSEADQLVSEQIDAMGNIPATDGPSASTLQEYADALIAVMKSSLTQKAASVDEPVDITAFLSNPSFIGDSSEGWTISEGTPGIYYSECEFYNTNFNIFQTLSGMPAGYYRFAIQGFYRDGSNADVYAKSIATDDEGNPAPENVLNAKIYANAYESDIQSWANFFTVGEEFTDYYTPNADAEADQVIYFPNTMQSANYLFDTKGMNPDGNSIDFDVDNSGSITVGVKKEATINDDWTIFDNCHLYYLGQTAPVGIGSVEADYADIHQTEIYTIGGIRVERLQKGINIVRTRTADGSVKVSKVLVK